MKHVPSRYFAKTIAKLYLIASVHLHSLSHSPCPYMTAAKWWLLGKRVRARGQFAPLFGRSSRAYTLWTMRDEQQDSKHSGPGSPPIIAMVSGQASDPQVALTLRSLALEQVPAFCMGSDRAGDIQAAADAIEWGASPWLMFVEPGSRIANGAVAAYRAAMTDPATRVIYADEDLLDRRGNRTLPHFKPDWNRELFIYFNYLTGACVLRFDRADLLAAAGHVDWQERLVAQVADQAEPLHLRRVLHHRTARMAPAVAASPLALAPGLPLVSVIIPTRNRVDLLRTCLDGLAETQYPDLEIIVVDNESDDPETLAYLAELPARRIKVLRHSGPFNYSAINNRAVAEASGQLICLLNNDIEMREPDWLAIMATQAMRDDVGAVGAQLLYPDGRIQHAGVVIGVGNAAGHAHRFLDPMAEGYFRRHALPQFTSAVTAACLVVQRERFLAVGGLDEDNFAVAFNDVDLCLRLNQRGWQSFYEPRAVLIHHESVSRGHDLDPVGSARFAGELAALQRIWKTDEIVDRYHHPNLSRASEQFVVAL